MEEQREMTLDEYVGRLTSHHAAARELYALRAERDAPRARVAELEREQATRENVIARADARIAELEAEVERLREALERHDIGCVVSRSWNEEQDMKKRGVQCKCLGCQTRAALRREQPTGGGEARDA